MKKLADVTVEDVLTVGMWALVFGPVGAMTAAAIVATDDEKATPSDPWAEGTQAHPSNY